MEILSQTQIKKMDNSAFHKYSKFAGANARKWKNHFVALLPEVARRGTYKKDFATITEFAAKVGGVGKKTVEAVFQMEKRLEDKPALKNLISEVGINKIRVIATIATKENQEELARKAITMTKSALEEVAKQEKNNTIFSQIPPGRNLFGGNESGKTADDENNSTNNNGGDATKREYLGFHVDKKTALELRKFKQKLEKNKKEKVDFNEVLKELLKIADGTQMAKSIKSNFQHEKKQKATAKHTITSRYIPAAKQRELTKKYNDCCAFPSCNKPSTQLHHPDRFAINKLHNRIIPLCDLHHELAHQGLIGNEEKLPNMWHIKLNPDINHPKYEIDQRVIAYKLGQV